MTPSFQDISQYLESVFEDEGSNCEIECHEAIYGGYLLYIKASSNPLNIRDEAKTVCLRGRDCKYHSLHTQEIRLTELECHDLKGADDWLAIWQSKAECWDEFTEAEDTHGIELWIGPEAAAQPARELIRQSFEAALVGEIHGDLYLVTDKLAELELPIAELEREMIVERLSHAMRRTLCC